MNKEVNCAEVCVDVWGDFAMFTRPDSKVERVTYPVPTPSACRGILRYQARILGHSMTEMKAFFTSGPNTLKIRSMVFRLAFRISAKKVVHCNVIFYKYHVEDV